MAKSASLCAPEISDRIFPLRGHRVLLDADLAALYGVTTARLNQQFRRNRERFPADFAFEVSAEERANLMLQNATSSFGHGGRRKSPLAFTEHGALMAATVLNSRRAVEMSVYVVRAFIRLRTIATAHAELARELEVLKRSVTTLDANTKRQFDQVYEAILELMSAPVRKQ
ncbi:MAG: ORF6N domain-containing protein [Proteobacteria bacterium]|nr:ORF6N domain-containing protein [Pseudomonadota bacterium]